MAATVDGFPALVLDDGQLAACFVPELGGRLVSLCRRGGREWMYHPGERLRLWRNRPGDSFRHSPHAGLDECLPTIAPCRVAGRQLTDHGSCWTAAWTLAPHSCREAVVDLSLDLTDPPLHLQRRASLAGSALRLDYLLTNRGTAAEPWGWAFHGLLALQAGDRIVLSGEVQSVAVAFQQLPRPLATPRWDWPSPRAGLQLDRAELGPAPACAKLVAGPLAQGQARLEGGDGQGLELRWPSDLHPWLGIWITRGGYLDQHALALEPSNLPGDSLEQSLPDAPLLAPGGSVGWWVELTPGPPP